MDIYEEDFERPDVLAPEAISVEIADDLVPRVKEFFPSICEELNEFREGLQITCGYSFPEVRFRSFSFLKDGHFVIRLFGDPRVEVNNSEVEPFLCGTDLVMDVMMGRLRSLIRGNLKEIKIAEKVHCKT